MYPKFRTLIQKNQNVLLFIAFAALTYVLVVIIVREKLDDLHKQVEVQLSQQQTLLTTIAQTTARNGADTVTEGIIKDCNITERTEFDTLLSKLDKGLTPVELTKLERLFSRCGQFYSQRKSVMVARLSREIEVYASYVDQLKAISTKKVVDSYNVPAWQNLAEEEKTQSDLFAKLVSQQETIISTLMAGKSAQSEEIKKILKEANDTQVALINANQRAAEVRQTLLPL